MNKEYDQITSSKPSAGGDQALLGYGNTIGSQDYNQRSIDASVGGRPSTTNLMTRVNSS
jgi:hypothetical protein